MSMFRFLLLCSCALFLTACDHDDDDDDPPTACASLWCIENVGGYNGDPAIAVDGQNRVHLLYNMRVTPTDFDLVYQRKDPEGWVTQTVSTEASSKPVLTVDADGNPHAFYRTFASQDYYAWWNGAAWSIEPVSFMGTFQDDRMEFRIDSAGNRHALGTTSSDEFVYAVRSGGSWSVQVLPYSPPQWAFLILDGASETPKVVLSDGSSLHVIRRVAGVWTTDSIVVLPPDSGLLPWGRSTRIDGSNSTIHQAALSSTGQLVYRRWNWVTESAWNSRTVDSRNCFYPHLSIDFGQVLIGYGCWTAADRLASFVAVLSPSGDWVLEPIEEVSGDNSHGPLDGAVAYGRDHIPLVLYRLQLDYPTRYARRIMPYLWV